MRKDTIRKLCGSIVGVFSAVLLIIGAVIISDSPLNNVGHALLGSGTTLIFCAAMIFIGAMGKTEYEFQDETNDASEMGVSGKEVISSDAIHYTGRENEKENQA